jgi:hypothetical protein
VVQGALVCDDGDVCTDDSCDSAAGCIYTELPDMDAVACQSDQVESSTPGTASKRALKNLRRAAKFVDQAQRKGPKGQIRKLKQASKLFEHARRDIGNDPGLSREVKNDLVEMLFALTAQIGELISDIQNSRGSK